jgi:periplasmic protein TonB
MFESVAPETFHVRSRRLFYETLPVSIALHAIVIAGVMATTLWTVVFPEHSPRAVRSYVLVSDPPPPPPPPPAAAPAPRPQPTVAPPPPSLMVLAPTKIPDLIPTVVDPPPQIEPAPVAAPPPAKQAGGEIDGDIGGKIGGRPGGVVFPDDGRVHIERNQQLPLVVVSQEYPKYPDSEKKAQREDQVIVRYVIGKDGRVNDVQILSHANFPAFDEAVLDALRQWRFRPMIKDGQRVEVVHELAINFELIRH